MSRRRRYSDDTSRGFVGRWSERKRRAREWDGRQTGDEVVESTGPGAGEEARHDDPDREQATDLMGERDSGLEVQDTEPVKTDEDMPDLDSIDENTNMSDFFSPGVSEQLRTQALRRLWRLSKFNVLDGLDDYNQDFRNFAPLGDIVTADMRHRMEVEQRRREELATREELDVDVAAEGGESGHSDDGDQQNERAVSADANSEVVDLENGDAEDGDVKERETNSEGQSKHET